MAPGLRSDGRPGPREEVGASSSSSSSCGAEPGGCSARRTPVGGDRGGCLRSRLRAGAAGMLANCLLSVAPLLLLVRCAVAAEEKSTYDASGFSPLPSSSAVTGAPTHPLTELSVAEEVPFQVVRSDVDPESEGGGLSGQPAFSSVLTVMAETVKHPASLDQSRVFPTVGRDETHTTQWPSRSSSRGSDESSSSSSFVGDSFQASSGLVFSMSQKPTTPPQAIWARGSRPSHTSIFKDGKKNLSSFPFLLLTSVSSSAPATSSVPSSLLSFFYPSSSTEQINKAVSSRGQGTVSSPASQTETAALSSGPRDWMDSLTTSKPTSLAVLDLHAVTQEMQNATSKPTNLLSETNTRRSSKMTTHSLDSIAEKIPENFFNATSRYMFSGAKTSTDIFYSIPNNSVNFSDNLYVPTRIQNKSLNSVSGNNLESSYSFLFNQESQAVRRQQGASQIPTSAPLSARAKGYSLSSHVTQQMLKRTAYIQTEDKTAADSNNLAHKSIAVNPSATPTMAFTPSRLFFTVSSSDQMLLSQTSPNKPTRIHSNTESLEHASNPGDLLMAVGHSSPRLPAININHNQREITRTEFRTASTQAHLDNSLLLTQLRPESGSILRLSNGMEVPLFTSESDLLKNVQESVTQTEPVKDATYRGRAALKMIFTPNSRTKSPSDPTEFSKFMTYKNEHQSSLHLTQPSYLSLSDSNHDPKKDPAKIFVSKEVNSGTRMSSLERPLQTQSFFSFLDSFSTPALPSEKPVELAGSPAETSAPIKSQGIAEFQTKPRNSVTSNMLHRDEPSAHFHQNTVKSYISPFFSGNVKSSAIYKTSHLLEQLTTRLPAFMTSENLFVLYNVSESSDKKSFAKSPPPKAFDGALELVGRLSHTDYGTYSPLAESENILTPKTNFSSLGLITSVSSDNSNSFLGRQTAVSSAVTSSFSDGQNSVQTSSAIFRSFGTKLMILYTKRKATKPMPLQSSAFKSENASSAFDKAKSNLPADGSSYEHQKLEDRQEHNVDVLNSDDSTSVTSDPYPTYPTVGEDPYITYVKGSTNYIEASTDLPPAYLRSAVTASALPEITSNTAATSAWGLDVSLPLSYIITDSETSSSQANSFALAYKGEHRAPVVDLQSSESVSDSAVTPPDFTTAQKRSVSQADVSSFSLFQSSSPSMSFSSFSSSFPQFSSLFMKPITPLSYSDNMLPERATVYPASSSVFVESTFSLPSPTLTSSSDFDHSQEVTGTFLLTEPEIDESTTGTSKSAVFTFPKDKEASLNPSQSDRVILSADPIEGTSQVSPVTPQQVTTTASVKLTTTTLASTTNPPTTSTPSVKVATHSISTTTPLPTLITRRTTTTTIRTYTSRRTFTSPIQRTSPPRGVTTVFVSPFTTTTEPPPPQCNITERLWVKTVVSIYVRRNRLDSIQRQNLRRGLSQGLRKALNDTTAQAQVETVFGSPNMTVAYHVTGGDTVYPPSVVMEGLTSYGRDKLIADLRQYLPLVTALPFPVALWRPNPATGFQLKTVLQFVGMGDDPRSCRFSQMMEQRLQRVFSEAQAKVLKVKSQLTVQMLSVSQAAGYPAVSLVYTVKNGTAYLNGTVASNLLGQLSAELVGYFLFYPPLIIAEPIEYHNLNTSIATRDFWIVTVIQDVDNASLEGQYQSFASLMEQRLAELFVLAGQQGIRFRRATTVGSFTVQMVSIRRVSGSKNPAEMTYYVQHNSIPLSGTSAAKVLNTVDSQTMALTLGYFVQLQAEPVVKNPPNNLWIIAAVLAPISVVTLIIIIITAVLCRKNKSDFKVDAIGNLNPRAKMAYRRDVSYYHQPVQGFDYAKQHLGQQGGDEETLPVSQDTLVMSLQIRDTSLSLEKARQQDGTANKKSLSAEKHKSKLPSEDGSVISNESEKLQSSRGLSVSKVTAQQKLTKEETRKRDDPYDSSSGSLQLISIKPMTVQNNCSQPAASERSQDSIIVNGEVNLALKQKSDIEHYKNKLRLKAKKKGYYDFQFTNGSSNGGQALSQKQRNGYEREAGEHGRPLEPDDEQGFTYVKSQRRQSQAGKMAYCSRQSLSSPSPGGTEMDLLVMRERPRRGIRNSGYDTEPELIKETNVDHLMGPRRYTYGRGLKGHSETSTLSSQPSIDEVRQQMHLLLEEAFSLASGGQSTTGRHTHHQQHSSDHYNSAPPPLAYADVVTSIPGTMSSGLGGLQWVPSYAADMYQCSLPKPAFRFTQLPEMALGSPPPLPPRTGPPPKTSLRRSTSDLGPKGRSIETSVAELRSQHENNPYGPTARAALPPITAEQPVSNYSGNPITAVYSIPATRTGYSEYFVPTSPTSYHSPSWMSYPPEPEDVPPQWEDSVPLPGYVEAFPNPRYPKGSPSRLPLQYNQTLEQPPAAPSTASEQSLPQVLKDMDSMPLSSLSTSALVQAIRQEVAKLAMKQNDMFEF